MTNIIQGSGSSPVVSEDKIELASFAEKQKTPKLLSQ